MSESRGVRMGSCSLLRLQQLGFKYAARRSGARIQPYG